MSQPNPKFSKSKAEKRSAATPYEAKQFDFSNVQDLSERALELHRTLYEGYVKETNALLPYVFPEGSGSEDTYKDESVAERLVHDGLVRRFAFEHNGMVLHELFFEALRGPSTPPSESGAFIKAVERSFGSFEAWKNDVQRLAQTRGVGWVITTQAGKSTQMGKSGRLYNVWIDEHSHGLLADWRPVLAIDLWEHAFLLDFKPSERSFYVTTVFENIDWKIVDSRCA